MNSFSAAALHFPFHGKFCLHAHAVMLYVKGGLTLGVHLFTKLLGFCKTDSFLISLVAAVFEFPRGCTWTPWDAQT